ncbi:hypothetical protein GTY54_19870, partial [Streptomyces sp. SID625]|nr:hypothetical protein [Streptomyces sp. SID625]
MRGNAKVDRRRVVIIGIGGYPRSPRLAADALTHPDLILIASAIHGLVPLGHPLHPYDVPL